jgi:hypothetical protein
MATIYKISSTKGDKIYIGSTVQPLKYRWCLHKNEWNTTSSSKLFELYGIDSCKIEAIEEVKAKDALSRERHWIQEAGELAVNERVPTGLSSSDYKKKWYNENRKMILERAVKYGKEHREKIRAYSTSKVLCECGSSVSRSHFAEHTRSLKHKSKMTIQKD